MNKFIKKQKKCKLLMNFMTYFSLGLIFVYIFFEPIIRKNYGIQAISYCSFALYFIVFLTLGFVLYYYSGYAKAVKFLEPIQNEIDDNGYYISSREITSVTNICETIKNDFKSSGFQIEENYDCNDFSFDFVALKRGISIYCVCIDSVDKNDVIAYMDVATYDCVAKRLRGRHSEGLVIFITDKADSSSIEVSKKWIYGQKNTYVFAQAIYECGSNNCYCLGNVPGKIQKTIFNNLLDIEFPVNEKYISKEKLDFQHKIIEEYQNFNLKDYKKGIYE